MERTLNAAQVEKLNFFPSVTLVITDACRMRCSFCCDDIFRTIKIEDKNISEIIDKLVEANVMRICYSGGDPLLSPYLEKYLEKTYSKGIENIVCTSDAKQLSRLDIPRKYFTDLRLSIHGLNEEHDKVTNIPNSFSDLEEAIAELKNKYSFSVTCVLRPESIGTIHDYVRWCKKNNMQKIYFTNLLRGGKGEKYIQSNGRISGEDFSNLICDLQETYSDQVKITPHSFEKNAECVIIYGNGDVYISPCMSEPSNKLKIGNLLEESPGEIFLRFITDTALWNDYCERMGRSTLIAR